MTVCVNIFLTSLLLILIDPSTMVEPTIFRTIYLLILVMHLSMTMTEAFYQKAASKQ